MTIVSMLFAAFSAFGCSNYLSAPSQKESKPHILVVEDERFQRETLIDLLTYRGFRVSGAESGAAMRSLVAKDPPELIILDLNLEGREDGFSLARFLREHKPEIGIVILTARDGLLDQVLGLEIGADDFVTKPYDANALLARVNSVLRRTGRINPTNSKDNVRIGKSMLNLSTRTLTSLAGEEIPLRHSEFELLKVLVENPNRPLLRDWLLEMTTGADTNAFDRAIDIRILRLRRKVEEDPARPTAIRTVRNVGYMFIPPKD